MTDINLCHPIIAKRRALQVEISHFSPHLVLVMYSPVDPSDRTSKAIDTLENLGYVTTIYTAPSFLLMQFKQLRISCRILCMWNLDSPELPSAVLVTYLTPCSVCIPSRNTVIAGTVEGTLLIWDLRLTFLPQC